MQFQRTVSRTKVRVLFVGFRLCTPKSTRFVFISCRTTKKNQLTTETYPSTSHLVKHRRDTALIRSTVRCPLKNALHQGVGEDSKAREDLSCGAKFTAAVRLHQGPLPSHVVFFLFCCCFLY